jgi:hypothetical protein
MKKITILFAFLIVITSTFAQKKGYLFLPKWNVGEQKTASIVSQETEYKNGKLISDTTIYLPMEMIVLKDNPNDYSLKIIYENIALRSVIKLYDKIGEDLPKYKNMELIYKVDKKTGKSELENWKEVKNFMNQSFDQITTLLKKKAPEMAGFAKMAFDPIKNMYKDKKSMEGYMTNEIGYLLFPYGKKFIIGDTLKTIETCQNPFNPMDSIKQTTLSYLSNMSDSKNTCDINVSEILDLKEFSKMMKTMMESLAKSFGVADSSKAKAGKAIDDIKFDMTNLTTITFDTKSTWASKIVKNVIVTVSEPKGKTEKIVKSTITIK